LSVTNIRSGFWNCAGLAILVGCSAAKSVAADEPPPNAAWRALEAVRETYAPDPHLAIFEVGIQAQGGMLVLTGEVDQAQAAVQAVHAVSSTGAHVTNCIRVLPSVELAEKCWGIVCLSVANGRLEPDHKAELGTQLLMGEVVRVWKRSTNVAFPWFLVQGPDGYLCWLERGVFVRCSQEDAKAWGKAPRLIATRFEESILEEPHADAPPVSDVVMCDVLKKTGEEGDWFKVELPDGRTGYLPKAAVADYASWQTARQATPESIERTARRFIGRPYLWGGASPRGFDCSGFTKTVFFLNGIDLQRDSSEQARQGRAVPLDAGLSQLRKGDLLFFGRRAREGRPERVTHVGLYLGDKLFIHSSEWVHLSSLDPDSPLRDEHRIRTLLAARRILTTRETGGD